MLDFAHYFRTVPQVLGVRRASHRQRSPGLAHHTGLFDDSCGGARCTGVESGRIFFLTSGFFFPSPRLSFRLHDSLGQCTRKCMEGNWADVRPASERRISSVDDLCARDAVCEPANGHDTIAMSWQLEAPFWRILSWWMWVLGCAAPACVSAGGAARWRPADGRLAACETCWRTPVVLF